MADVLADVEIGRTWKQVQISGTGAPTSANFISFLRPVQVRRVIANLSAPNDPFSIRRSIDGTTVANQIEILVQNCTGEAAQSLIHPDEFSLHLPQTTVNKSLEAGGFIYLEAPGFAGSWTLTVEAKE
ncbi:MAG: hypothetical protein AAGM67_00340 [Bacteroidota bacterium]